MHTLLMDGGARSGLKDRLSRCGPKNREKILALDKNWKRDDLEVLVTPNPGNNFVQVEYATSKQQIPILIISDLEGKQMMQSFPISNSSTHVIDTGGWQNGVYLFSFYLDGKLYDSQRIIIMH